MPLTPEAIAALRESEREGRDRGAPTFLEKVRASRGAFRFEAELRTLLHHIAPHPDQVVLDAGAGVGRYALAVAPRVARLVCADLSAGALEVLHEAARARRIANLETLVCDLAAPPADLGPFDTVYSSEVLQHVPGRAQHVAMLRGFRRVLRPGGRCLVNVTCWNGRGGTVKEGFVGEGEQRVFWHRFAPGELRGLMVEAGFREVTLHAVSVLPGLLSRRLPLALTFLETWCSEIPALSGAGRLVLAGGRR